jgi:hypothetical protein
VGDTSDTAAELAARMKQLAIELQEEVERAQRLIEVSIELLHRASDHPVLGPLAKRRTGCT